MKPVPYDQRRDSRRDANFSARLNVRKIFSLVRIEKVSSPVSLFGHGPSKRGNRERIIRVSLRKNVIGFFARSISVRMAAFRREQLPRKVRGWRRRNFPSNFVSLSSFFLPFFRSPVPCASRPFPSYRKSLSNYPLDRIIVKKYYFR